jgi:hypothetical protein
VTRTHCRLEVAAVQARDEESRVESVAGAGGVQRCNPKRICTQFADGQAPADRNAATRAKFDDGASGCAAPERDGRPQRRLPRVEQSFVTVDEQAVDRIHQRQKSGVSHERRTPPEIP